MKTQRGPWFHCAHPEEAIAFMEEGFDWAPADRDFREFFDLYIEALPSVLLKPIDKVAGDYGDPSQIPQEAVDLLTKTFRRLYRQGSVIWVSDDYPRHWYGTACFEVRLPEAEILYKGHVAGILLYVPWKPIPPDRFTPIYGPWGLF